MSRTPKRMSEVLDSARGRRTGVAKTLLMASVASAWQEHMRGKYATGSAVNAVREGVLHISVDEPVWAQHLSMQKKQILNELSQVCDTAGIKDIRFSSFGSTERPSSEKRGRPEEGGKMADSSGRLSGSLRKAADKRGKDDVPAKRGKAVKCGVCGMITQKGLFCPVCINKKHPERVADAVKYLMAMPIASDADVKGACTLDNIEPDEAYEVIVAARDAAGRRLVQEAIVKASAGNSTRKQAGILMAASACASTGLPYDVIISRGLDRFFSPSIMKAAGLDQGGDEEGERPKKR